MISLFEVTKIRGRWHVSGWGDGDYFDFPCLNKADATARAKKMTLRIIEQAEKENEEK